MLFLVRHAHSAYGPDEMRALSEAGHRAAHRVADLLEDRGVAMIVSSPYTRAVETVQPLADRLGISIAVDSDLRERHLSAGPLDDFQRRLEATWSDFDLAYPGGESSAAAQTRVSRAIRRVVESAGDRTVVVASHGNALALFLRTIDSTVDFRFWSGMSMPDVYAVEPRKDAAWSYQRVWSYPAESC
jgi:2,3-bisphosphoglycerate-dependent phosphoglycerate mutase